LLLESVGYLHGGVKVYRGSATAARNYVEADRCRADDYYLTEGTGLAERLTANADGHVMELAALSGDGYEAWVAGHDPDTGEPRGRVRNDDHAVRFVEVVVNGPKSWSLAAELHPDVAAAYEAAHDRAARQILGWLGQHATTRVGPRGQQVAVPVQRMEAAVIRHYTSRAGDPHRHLHLQVNARVFAAGKWRGLDTVAFRDSIQAINGIGHAAVVCDPDFRATLAGHGYTLTDEGEVAQLAPYVGAFSKRAGQIGRLLDRYEAAWRAEHPGQEPGPQLRRSWDARAWAEDRPDKVVPRDGAELRDRWLAELAELGYRDRDKPLQLALTLPGTLDRDAAAAEVIARLGAGRSAWNAADVRGQVEQLLARAGVIAEPAARVELAEDLTARALDLCLPLQPDAVTPEHIRALTSRHVLDVEADLTARLAARGAHPVTPAAPTTLDGLDAGQRAAITALGGDARLVVVEGAAGAGKTTLLAVTRNLLDAQDRRIVVVTPTLKAAQVAGAELHARAGSAAWLAWQHGWRWHETGTWTRQPHNPAPEAQLRRGDLLVVDEAAMLDQDTARALLTIADETGARIGLLGDRHQLPAVGRGGVLDLAHRWAHTDARLDLDSVHRFVRTVDGTTVPDREYAGLSLAMRAGDDPGTVFDALLTRGQIAVYPSDIEREDALAEQIAAERLADRTPVVVVDTRELAAAVDDAIRRRLVTAGRVDDQRVAVTSDGQRLGAGDVIVTRRNDPDLGVANRESWTVSRVHRDGRLTLTDPQRGARQLTADYARRQVELGYAVTGYGAQGDTTDTGHLVLTDHTSAAAAYVAMTRGRHANTAHLVAADMDDAREQWIAAFGRGRADLGPAHAGEQAGRAALGYRPARPLDQVRAELHEAWREQARAQRELDQATALRERLTQIAALQAERDQALAPLKDRHEQAQQQAEQARAAADHSAALIDQHAAQIRAQLTAQWQAQHEAATRAAYTVQKGPGRLGLHLVAVNRATEDLARWSLTWQPYLPDMPTDTHGIALYAIWRDNPDRLDAAFDRYARHEAERAHPEHPALQQAAEHAERQQDEAWRQLGDRQYRWAERLVEYGSYGYREDAAQDLDELQPRLAGAELRLSVVERRLDQLAAEPAVGAQPDGWLPREQQRWQRAEDAAEQTRQHERELAHQQPAYDVYAEHDYGIPQSGSYTPYAPDAGRAGPSFGM
jgi:exodeoxyribonuclease V alpha subunit